MGQFFKECWSNFTALTLALGCAAALAGCGPGTDEAGSAAAGSIGEEQQQQQQQQQRPVPSPEPTPTASPTVEPTPNPTASPSPTPSPVGVSVSIPADAMTLGANAFGTNPLSVPVGTTVTWTNNDTVPHTVTSDNGLFDSGVLQPGQQFPFTFTTAGTFTYKCTIHPEMVGSVQVE